MQQTLNFIFTTKNFILKAPLLVNPDPRNGYVYRDLKNVMVTSSAATDVGAVVLIIDIGVDGQIIINRDQGAP